jgi:hypothetical protein
MNPALILTALLLVASPAFAEGKNHIDEQCHDKWVLFIKRGGKDNDYVRRAKADDELARVFCAALPAPWAYIEEKRKPK